MSFTIQKITDLEEAKKYWSLLTPGQTIYDVWDFRYCAYAFTNHELAFYVGFEAEEPVGLLPLEYHGSAKYLEFFGGRFMEDNKIFLKKGYEDKAPYFWQAINLPARLSYITASDSFASTFPILDYRYSLPLAELGSVENYIQTRFHGETKKKLLKRIRKFEFENEITILENQWDDLDLLFYFNKEKFKADSIFHFPFREALFKELAHSPFSPKLLTFIINGKKQAVTMSLAHKKTYVSLNSGVSAEASKDLSSFMRLKKIEHAFKHGMTLYDALANDCGWKDAWHFDKSPQYEWRRDLPPEN